MEGVGAWVDGAGLINIAKKCCYDYTLWLKAQHILSGSEEERKSSYDGGLITIKTTLSFSYQLIK